jgi:hypothetical protein
MVDGISGAERPPQHFGTIVVIGGGCYGRYYLRQLRRGAVGGAIHWEQLLLVDRDPSCAAAPFVAADVGRPEAPAARLACAEWGPFLDHWVPTTGERDAVVPSPLMPHLFYEYLERRALRRWPARRTERIAQLEPVGTPWEQAAPDGTRYVSHATWMCPVNCIEPARCPKTRGARDWSMPETLARAAAGTPRIVGPFTFHCTHRAFGVGMVDARAIVAADAAIARAGAGGRAVEAVIATASHCHGAVAGLRVSAAAVPLGPRADDIS